MTITWSHYSLALFDKIQTGNSNLFINAVAGSGKTTNLVHIANSILKNSPVLCVAFNNSIANELKRRIHNPNACIGTIHSIAFNAIKSSIRKTKVNKNKYAHYFQSIAAQFSQNPDKIETQSHYLHKTFTLALLTQTEPNAIAKTPDYDIELEPKLLENLPQIFKNALEYAEQSLPQTIDFIDMLYFANKYQKTLTQFDHILVDEAQDLSNLQLDYIKKLARPKTLFAFFGDKFQSIYAFAGANATATQTIISTLNCQETPLSISYRCPKTHIELAKTINPTIEAAPNAPNGILLTQSTFDIAQTPPHTLIISRTNFPLFALAFQAAKQKKIYNLPAKNIALSLYATATTATDGNFENPATFEIQCKQYLDQKFNQFGQTPYFDILNDKIKTLTLIANETPTLKSLQDLKTAIFSLTRECLNPTITLSSIHRAKGLEAPNIIFLYPETIPHKKAKGELRQQEFNLKYVAFTRSTHSLTLIEKP